MSYVLRHHPELIDLTVDKQGWASVDALVAQAGKAEHRLTHEQLCLVVAHNTKNRFELSEDHKLIRARQGHSIPIDLGYAHSSTPAILYHGTDVHNAESILEQGLQKLERHHVHLSPDLTTAK